MIKQKKKPKEMVHEKNSERREQDLLNKSCGCKQIFPKIR